LSLFSLLTVSSSGMAAQRTRAELLVENMANAETTRTPEGGPYRRKDAVFEASAAGDAFASELETQMGRATGVRVAQILRDTREPELRYQPGHPDANAEGYVAMPRISPAEEMVDLMNANRSYQANISAIAVVKDMIQKSISLLQ